MKLNHTNGFLLGAISIAVASLQSSCSTADSQAWAKIQNEGLIPYLVEGQAHGIQQMDSVPSEAIASRQQQDDQLAHAEQPREIRLHHSGMVTAQEVAGKPGFVYSPHTIDLLEVDVRDFGPGAEVRCPYTKKSFVVPGEVDGIPSRDEVQIASNLGSGNTGALLAPPKIVSQPKKDARSTPATPIVTPKKEEVTKIAAESLPLDPKPITGIPKTNKLPTEQEALAMSKKPRSDVPVAKRVGGKPNYVYSPFAASNQVVDVEGHAPGTKVKCPYTGKVFAVPAK